MIVTQPLVISSRIGLTILLGIAASLLGCAARHLPEPSPSAGRPPAAAPTPAATPPQPPAPSAAIESQPPNAVSASDEEKAPDDPPVIVALLEESEASRSTGDLDNAAASLERALRIQPRNARLWHQLARVRLEQGEPTVAEELAQKSSALALDNEALIAANQELMDAARKRQGLGAPAPAAAE
jgi:tetratricopeptide (TPR) repeat protein